MKKTILTIMVAAMMLVAFTACEQPVPGLSKAIIGADIEQTGTIFAGQPFDASKFTVTVTYSDKSTATLKGANVTFAGKSADSVQNGELAQVKLPISTPNYSGNGNGSIVEQTFETAIVAYKFSSLTITGTETIPYAFEEITEEDGSVTPVGFVGDVEIISVVGNYKDKTGAAQQYTFSADEYEVGNATMTLNPTADKAGKASITVTPDFGMDKPQTYEFETTLYDGPEKVAEYVWYKNMIAYSVVPAAANGPEYIARGQFDADSMLKFYKVMVDESKKDSAQPTDYRFEELVPAQGESLSVKLASTSALDEKENADRFNKGVTTSGATIDFSYWYISNEATGAMKQLESSDVSGVVTLNDEAEDDGSVGGTIVSGSSSVVIPTATFIDDYAEAVACTYKAGTAIAGGTSYDQTSLPVMVTRWASGYAPATQEAASTVGSVTYDKKTAATEGTSEVVTWTFTPTNRYVGYGVVSGNVTVTLEN